MNNNLIKLKVSMYYFNMIQKMLIIRRQMYSEQVLKRRKQFIKSLTRTIQGNYIELHKRELTIAKELSMKIPKKKERKIWMKNRSRHWWRFIVGSSSFDDQMIDNFRMDRQTFQFICSKLHNELAPNSAAIREALSVEQIVAIAIYKLASCAEYRIVGNQFGVHKSTVHKCLRKFCKAVTKVLLKEEIKLPCHTKAIEIINGFKNKSGIPQILGAIDGTHIPITAPSDGHADNINRKGWTSLILQAVVDCDYKFIDITCKHPGSCHDATVLKDSSL